MKGLNGPRTFVVRMPDDSMAPLFGEGDYVHVDPDAPAEAGGFVAVREAAGATTVRALAEEDGRRLLWVPGDARRALAADAGGVEVLGVVVFRGRAV